MWNHGSTSWNDLVNPSTEGAVTSERRRRPAAPRRSTAPPRCSRPGRRGRRAAHLHRARRRAGLAKSTTSRLLAALERTELLERDGAGGVRRRPAVLRSTPPGTTRGTSWPSWPARSWSGSASDTGETVNLGVARGDRGRQVAQVDSPLPPRRPRLDRRRRARRTARRWARCSTPSARSPLPAGPARAAHHRRRSPTPTPLRRDGSRAIRAGAAPSPSTSSSSGSPPSPPRLGRRRRRSSPPLGVSGPTAAAGRPGRPARSLPGRAVHRAVRRSRGRARRPAHDRTRAPKGGRRHDHPRRSCRACTTRRWSATPRACSS